MASTVTTDKKRYRRFRWYGGSHAEILRHGPLLYGTWSLPGDAVADHRARGKPEPEPVAGALLLDTGATKSCISREAAQQLVLQPLRVSSSYGSVGLQEHSVFRACLTLRDRGEGGSGDLVGWEMNVTEVAQLTQSGAELGISIDGTTQPLIGLLGWNVLCHARFSFDPRDGIFRITFDTRVFDKG